MAILLRLSAWGKSERLTIRPVLSRLPETR